MFMSFSKTIAKVGGFRFGIRMRRTKSNSLWFFLALSVIYTCQFMWYSMVVCLWVMYAMAYGVLKGIGKLYRILSKRFGKPIAVAIIVGFFTFLYILGSCSNSNAVVDTTAPTTAQVETVG